MTQGRGAATNPLPPGPFGVVMADPAWPFRTYGAEDLIPTQGEQPYAAMSMEDMLALPVADVAAKDAALFMWVIDSHFNQALALGEAWGFEYKTCAFVWVKTKVGGWVHPGMGYYTRKQTEQCWLFTRGKPKRLNAGVEQIIHCARGAHSAKPEQQYEKIEALFAGPYLEMFARTTRRGWAAWGDQVGARDGLFPASVRE